MSTEILEQELLTKKIKHNLENWRELVLPAYDVLMWKQFPLYPGIIVGVSTVVFSLIALSDPTLLSFVASLCLCLVLLDYAAPLIVAKMFDPESWTGQKEKKFESICGEIAFVYIIGKTHVWHFYSLKETRPKVYYLTSILGLLLLSWVGNNVNNIFITYLYVTSLLLLPGLKCNGYLEKCTAYVKQFISQSLRSAAGKKEKKQ